MDKRTSYQIHCRTCNITYKSDIKPIVGQPCPNPFCPRANPPIGDVWWQHPVVRVAMVAGGLTLGGILFFNVGGWGAFALDLTVSFLFQTVIALIMFGVLLTVFMLGLKEVFGQLMSNRYILSGIFLIAAVLALPTLPFAFHRSIDIYDVAQTIVLGIAANLLTKPLEQRLAR